VNLAEPDPAGQELDSAGADFAEVGSAETYPAGADLAGFDPTDLVWFGLIDLADDPGTVRNLVCEAMMMRTDGASYGDRERFTGPTFGRS
jgi:hypothetical protein